MKKLGISLLATMGMAWALGLGFGLGGDVGYGMGSWKAEDTSGSYELNGSGPLYGGGAKIDLWITEALGLDLGVRYDIANASGKAKLNGTEADSTTTGQATLLVIPIFLKYGLPMTGMKPYFGLGFSVVKEMSAKSKYGEGDWEAVDDTLLEMDYALLAGGGLNMPLGPVILNPDLRLLYNLTPLRKGDTLPGVDYSASQMEFILGVNFLYSLPLAGE